MRKLHYFSFLVATFFFLFAATDVTLVRFAAEVQQKTTNEVALTWIVSNEKNVESYTIKRKMSHQNEFAELTVIKVKDGVDELEGRKYVFTDKNIFKQSNTAEPLLYVLYANSAGESQFVAQIDVNYTTTSVRRTWGSIKAMFQ